VAQIMYTYVSKCKNYKIKIKKAKDKMLKIELAYDPVKLLLGIYPRECKTG
jgi:hypothetical protein